MHTTKSLLTRAVLLSAGAALSGCNAIVMKPHGDIAQQQSQLIVTATVLMLLIIVPVIALTLLFAWRYRQSNTDATYAPDWDHSTRLELVIWGAPLLIIIALGAVTWISTHKLDPFRPLDRIAEDKPLAPNVKPLEVYAVSMDWKWLFIYPEQGIATVNELAAPVDRPIHFRFTSTSVMNTFYVPALAGMIYTMPGMETQLHAVINKAGVYDGLSAQYSGAGFSDMRFKFHGLSDEDFARWIDGNKAGGNTLTRADYLKLEQPSTKEPIQRFASVEPGLWSAIVDRCVDGKKMCTSQMMAIDAAGGAGKGGVASTMRSAWRDVDGVSRERTVVAGLCTPTNLQGLPVEAETTAKN
ncbi:ubiquinol oxidase subunit II [Pelomonas cellulosilytica]|uniref:Ubiquinol oxidase subunit 2 n=1 Tax=Pelomonas cellulosilytica TaxID=2906762 RepID=A0ABS8XTX3_9BURK|nr:ubiquinol oxidase subunit II [Pelomonas sp. P8]MCE4556151.1 ubiquinol oxidase subunit II [Pelomonas sp. P8]